MSALYNEIHFSVIYREKADHYVSLRQYKVQQDQRVSCEGRRLLAEEEQKSDSNDNNSDPTNAYFLALN